LLSVSKTIPRILLASDETPECIEINSEVVRPRNEYRKGGCGEGHVVRIYDLANYFSLNSYIFQYIRVGYFLNIDWVCFGCQNTIQELSEDDTHREQIVRNLVAYTRDAPTLAQIYQRKIDPLVDSRERGAMANECLESAAL
jgi:hypothetical protein